VEHLAAGRLDRFDTRNGLSNDRSKQNQQEIADELGLSTRIVENHRFNIGTKLNRHGVHSLVKFAFDHKSEL